jgi:hypothetical protein
VIIHQPKAAQRRHIPGQSCDLVLHPAVSQAPPSEPFFESLSRRPPCFPEEYGGCDESYSGSFRHFGTEWQSEAGGGKTFCLSAFLEVGGVGRFSTCFSLPRPAGHTRQLSRFGTLDPDHYKYSGGVLAPNGKIYCMPDRARRILVIDPVAESMQYLDEDLGEGTAKAFGGVLAPNGKIYSGLAGVNRIMVIDPSSESVTYINDLPANKYVGGVLGPDGRIYCIPNRPGPVLVIDPESHDVSYLTGSVGNGEYWGAVLTPHGSIIGVPWNATSILMIDFGVKVPADWALSRLYNRF